MSTMHDFFDLKTNRSEAGFAEAYEKFAAHLPERKLLIGSHAMRRKPDATYDSSPPETKYYISMDFSDMAQARECWDYIEEGATNLYTRIQNHSLPLHL